MWLFSIILFGLLAGILPTLAGAGVMASALIPIAVVLFGAGAALGFMLPLIPFFRFFFGAMSWIIGVFEAVAAAPLLALAHVNPEGDGLPGAMARTGYYLILNMFLRPVLMIIGLVAGFLLFSVALGFLNTMFSIASQSTGAFDTLDNALAKIVFTVLYCALVYTCGNHAFKAIGMFPQHALKWLGQGPGHIENMGSPNITQGALSGVGGLLAGQTMGGLLRAPSDIIKGKQDSVAAAQKHQEMLNAIAMSGMSGGGANASQIATGVGSGGPSGVGPSGGSSSTGGPIPPMTDDHEIDSDAGKLVAYWAQRDSAGELAQLRAEPVEAGGEDARRYNEEQIINRSVRKYSNYLRESGVDEEMVRRRLLLKMIGRS
jgi:hypothetical protein